MPETSSATRYTHRGNRRDTRHGWLRLTPAYSLHLVRELVAQRTRPDLPVLDPFCGTGTTLLACAEANVACDTIDLNPFLVWLARAKVARYSTADRRAAVDAVTCMSQAARSRGSGEWRPALHRIERWWDRATLDALSRAFAALGAAAPGARSRDLALLAFCRALISTSNASFRHQSMSFSSGSTRKSAAARASVAQALREAIASLERAASIPLPRAQRRALLGDSRCVSSGLDHARYGSLITSPPYANRMSYIRELRPYMYWLGYLSDGADAGRLDWQAIGGTWGSATSNLTSWKRPAEIEIPYRGYRSLVRRIEAKSTILARYVDRYFCDMAMHLVSVRPVLADGATVHYIVGNSKFYDVLLPLERILAAQLVAAGFRRPEIAVLRKRTSKAELFEFRVSARTR